MQGLSIQQIIKRGFSLKSHIFQAKQGGFLMDAIKWNFTKFVVDKEGQPKARFAPTDDPIPKVEEECKKYF